MRFRILIKEKQDLQEITRKQVEQDLQSKKFLKKLRKATQPLKLGYVGDYDEYGNYTDEFMKKIQTRFVVALSYIEPRDITPAQEGAAVNWFKNYALNSKPELEYMLSSFRDWIYRSAGPYNRIFEKFFQFQDFMEPGERDINSYQTIGQLENVVDKTEPKYQAHIEKKKYLDAEEGSELVYEDDEWEVYIPRNKGAACELGKGTEWCTAAPGLDYYEEYHSDEHPLYIFINSNTGEKYQFHYKSLQFMNAEDNPVFSDVFIKLHQLLIKADVLTNEEKESVEIYPEYSRLSIRKKKVEMPHDGMTLKKKKYSDIWYDYEMTANHGLARFESESRIGQPCTVILTHTRQYYWNEKREVDAQKLVKYEWKVADELLGEIYYEWSKSDPKSKLYMRNHRDEDYPHMDLPMDPEEFNVHRDWPRIAKENKQIADFIATMNRKTIEYAEENEK